jgi:hypothetical protein
LARGPMARHPKCDPPKDRCARILEGEP